MFVDRYLIPFWVVSCIIVFIIGILVWLSVTKSKDSQMIQTGLLGVRCLMNDYIDRCLQKTVLLMIKFEKLVAKKGLDIRLEVERNKLDKNIGNRFSSLLLRFARGKDIAEKLFSQVGSTDTFEKIDLFLLPDVLVYKCGDDFYTYLLRASAKIVTNDSSLFDNYTNDDSKQYLLALIKNVQPKGRQYRIEYKD